MEETHELLTRVKRKIAGSEKGGNRQAAALMLRGSLSSEEAAKLREESLRLRNRRHFERIEGLPLEEL